MTLRHRFAVPRTILTLDQLEEVAAFYAGVDEFVFDVETVGKHRGHPKLNRVTWLGLAHGGRTDVIPMGHPNGELLRATFSQKEPWWDENDLTKRGKPRKKWRTVRYADVFSDAPEQLWATDVWEALEPAFFGTARKIGHNVKFDLLTVAKYFDDTPPAPPYGDSMILAHLLNSNKKYGLKDITTALWGHDYDQENIAKPDKHGENGIEIHAFSKAARYTHLDVRYTWLIYQEFRRLLHERGSKNLDDLEHDVLESLLPGAMYGMRLDVDAMKELGAQLTREHQEIEKRIFHTSGKVWDLNSAPAKRRFVYEERGHEPFAFTKGGKDGKNPLPQTTAAVLEAYAKKDPAIADLVDYAVVQKLRSTYSGWQNEDGSYEGGLLNHVVDGRVYTDLVQYGTDTGRFSSRKPNLQNIPSRSEDPRAKALRKMFVSDPGHSFIVADYAQIEYRVLASLAREPVLLNAFASGWDPHAAVMSMILDKPIEDITKKERDLGKSINFACVPADNTEILTRDGWKKFDEVKVGDETLGYEGESLVWTPVTAVHHYETAAVSVFGNEDWAVETTENHRWLSQRRTGRGDTRRAVEEMVASGEVTTEHRLRLSAPADSGAEGNPLDAAVIGWLLTDGHLRWSDLTRRTAQAGGKRRGVLASIFQSKPEQVAELDRLLVDVPHRRYIRPTGIVQWLLNPQWVREVWERNGLHERSYEDWVRTLSRGSRDAFLDAVWRAEGWRAGGSKMVSQNAGGVHDAIVLATYLSGYLPRVHTRREDPRANHRHYDIRFGKPWITGQKWREGESRETSVWCVTTGTGTWTARQGSQVFLTGNSIYGAGAGRISNMADVTLKRAKWIKSTYEDRTPKVTKFKKNIINTARNRKPQPYVETLLRRRRWLPALWSPNDRSRFEAERQAVNTVVQGTAADVIKVAMVKLHTVLPEHSVMLLQVHDELVLQAPDEHVEDVRDLVQNTMESVRLLEGVELQADANIGKSWAEAK